MRVNIGFEPEQRHIERAERERYALRRFFHGKAGCRADLGKQHAQECGFTCRAGLSALCIGKDMHVAACVHKADGDRVPADGGKADQQSKTERIGVRRHVDYDIARQIPRVKPDARILQSIGITVCKQPGQRTERAGRGIRLGKGRHVEQPFRRAGRSLHAVAGAQPVKIHEEIVGSAAERHGLGIGAGVANLENAARLCRAGGADGGKACVAPAHAAVKEKIAVFGGDEKRWQGHRDSSVD